MYIPYFCRYNSEDEFIKTEKTEFNCLGFEPTAKAEPEGFRDYYNFLISHALDNDLIPGDYMDIMYSKKKLAALEIKYFRESNAYKDMSPKRRKEVEDYINNDPMEEISDLDL